jgi:hypothetical protein
MDNDHTGFCVGGDVIVGYLSAFGALSTLDWAGAVHDLCWYEHLPSIAVASWASTYMLLK